MLDPIELEFDAPTTTHRPRVIEGGMDLDRFAATIAMLEHYVDGLIVADEPPAMDPWIDDEDIELRLSCL